VVNQQARAAYPTLASRAKATRLNPLGGIELYRDTPNVVEVRERIKRFGAAAASNLVRLIESGRPPLSRRNGRRICGRGQYAMSRSWARRDAIVRVRLVVCLLPFAAGCASVAQITNLPDPGCRQSLTGALAAVLQAQGETPQVAANLAESTATALEAMNLGPRPFLVAAPSGVDYSFFVERKGSSCVLRLYGRQKGFVSYTNDISYIATEPLAPCECAE
jgi:hypothetical protein